MLQDRFITSNFTLFHANARNLLKNLDNLTTYLNSFTFIFSIIAITITWATPDNEFLLLDHYHFFLLTVQIVLFFFFLNIYHFFLSLIIIVSLFVTKHFQRFSVIYLYLFCDIMQNNYAPVSVT